MARRVIMVISYLPSSASLMYEKPIKSMPSRIPEAQSPPQVGLVSVLLAGTCSLVYRRGDCGSLWQLKYGLCAKSHCLCPTVSNDHSSSPLVLEHCSAPTRNSYLMLKSSCDNRLSNYLFHTL